MLRNLMLIGCLHVFTVLLPAQTSGTWKLLPPLPTPRQEVGVARVGAALYVVGGFDQNRASVNTVERYDARANQWSAVEELPATSPLNHVGAAGAIGNLYVIGGLSPAGPADTVFEFNPQTMQWRERERLPAPRGAMAVAVSGDSIYTAGGLIAPGGSVQITNQAAVYDPAQNQWTPLPPMQQARDHLAGAAVNGKFYAIGGRGGGLLFGNNEMFDPDLNQWFDRAPLPTPRAGIAAAVHKDKIYVFGGEGNPANPQGIFDQVEAYDPASNTWETFEPMPLARHGIGAAALPGRIHIPGGGPIAGFSTTNRHDAFVPPHPSPQTILDHLLGLAPSNADLDLNEDSLTDIADLTLVVFLEN